MSNINKDKSDCNTVFQLDQEFHLKFPQTFPQHHVVLYKKIRNFIRRTSCFSNVENILVALSGGVDSSVLLHMLSLYHRYEKGPKVVAVHIHHGQRGAESDRDEEMARANAAQCGCVFESVKLTDVVPGMSEDALRKLRHQHLKQYAKKNACERIVLGHHMDDQVETFLFRLIRGADVRGLVAMTALQPPYVRPMLECTRQEIERDAEGCGIAFVEDSSNISTGPSRNFLRNIVIPALKAKLDPQVSQHIFDLSQSLGEIDSLIASQAVDIIDRCRESDHVYSVWKLKKVPPALRKRSIQLMYTYIIKDSGALSRDQVDMINGWIERSQSPKYLLLPNHVRVDKSNGVLMFSSSPVAK